jgi:phenylpyruvate tautomerase PptA (4-oxalocrotonate tautomerase family)
MPVITIRALPQPGVDIDRAASKIAAAIAEAAGVGRQDIWIVWSDIAAGRYVIADSKPTVQPTETHPPLVEISSTSGRSPEVAEAMMQAAAQAVGAELRIPPSNVRVLYAEIPPRRLFSRGRFQ